MATVTNLKPALSLVTTINIDAKDQYGRTSLHRAILKSEEAVAEGMNEQAAADSILKIMANGASLDILDETHRTPLDYAGLLTLRNMTDSIASGFVLNDKQAVEIENKILAYLHSNRRDKEIKKLNQQTVETKAINTKKRQIVKQRVILSRLVVETASNSFHLSMSPSSVLAGGFWSDLYGHDLRNTQALFSTKANDYRHC